jgi:hypothetical protein
MTLNKFGFHGGIFLPLIRAEFSQVALVDYIHKDTAISHSKGFSISFTLS